VRVTDEDGGSATASTVVQVDAQTLGASATNDGPVRRGQPATVTVAATQELSDVLTYGFDFDNNGAFEVVQPDNSAAHVFPNTGIQRVGFGVTDGNGGVATGATNITVLPQLLTISAVSNSGPVLQDQPVTVVVTAAQELSDPLTYSFDWNVDGVFDVVDQLENSAGTTYSAVGDKTVRVRVRDVDGGEAIATTTVRVNAQRLEITAVSNDAPKRRGQQVSVSVTVAQQLNEPLFYSFDWDNDGAYDVIDQASDTAATIYVFSGTKTVGVRVRDTQNNEAVASTTLLITAQELSATATNDGPARRGQDVLISVSATQELSDTLTYGFDFDDDGVDDLVTTSASAVISYTTAGLKTVTVRVTDEDGASTSAATAVQVDSQTLSIIAVTNTGPAEVGQAVTVTVDAVSEVDGPLLYSFDWDNDGIFDVVDQPIDSASTSYDSAGSKVVGLRVTDGKGAEATTTTVLQIYEVTGGGLSDFLYLPIVSR
jgi:hypothetical protein